MSEPEFEPVPEFLRARGITDRASALDAAHDAAEMYRSAFRKGAPRFAVLYQATLVLMGFATRIQGFHEASVSALQANNQFAAFTLLRSLSETVAAMNWLLKKPQDIERFFVGATQPNYVKPGRLVDFAVASMPGFRDVYEQLSEFAHPSATGTTSSLRVGTGEREIEWSSAPVFKSDGDYIMACGWTVELSEAASELWLECVDSLLPRTAE